MLAVTLLSLLNVLGANRSIVMSLPKLLREAGEYLHHAAWISAAAASITLTNRAYSESAAASAAAAAASPRPRYPPAAYRRVGDALHRVPLKDFMTHMSSYKVVLLGETHDDPTAHALEQLIVGQLKPAALTLEMAESRTEDAEAALQAGEAERRVLHVERERRGSSTADRTETFLDADDPARMIAPSWDIVPYGELARIPASYGGRCVAANPPREHVSTARKAGVAGLRQLPLAEQALLPPLDETLHLLPHGARYREASVEIQTTPLATKILLEDTDGLRRP